MTHARTSDSYTDLVTVLRARQDLLTWDRNISGSIDGAKGGPYALRAPLAIGGSGIGVNPLLDSVIGTGQTLSRDERGHVARLHSVSTLVDTAATQVVDTSFDAYWTDTTQTQTWVIELTQLAGSGEVPVIGDQILLSALGGGGGFIVSIQSETVGGGFTGIAEFPAAYSKQVSGSPMWALLEFGTVIANLWQCVELSADGVKY